jgi:hypothetical protein
MPGRGSHVPALILSLRPRPFLTFVARPSKEVAIWQLRQPQGPPYTGVEAGATSHLLFSRTAPGSYRWPRRLSHPLRRGLRMSRRKCAVRRMRLAPAALTVCSRSAGRVFSLWACPPSPLRPRLRVATTSSGAAFALPRSYALSAPPCQSALPLSMPKPRATTGKPERTSRTSASAYPALRGILRSVSRP